MQLPVNIHLLTVQDNSLLGDAGSMILRLDHSFEVGEDPVYSQPVTLDLESLFVDIELHECTEMTLTANQDVWALFASDLWCADGRCSWRRCTATSGRQRATKSCRAAR